MTKPCDTAVDEAVHVSIEIAATIDTVWQFMSDGAKFASWIGAFAGQEPAAGTKIDPRVGGAIRIEYPGNNAAVGEFTEFALRERIAFTWGYEDAAQGVAPGSTNVEIRLHGTNSGTRVELRHTGLPTPQHRDGHRGGWTHYLSMLARNATASHYEETASAALNNYFATWSEPDGAKRAALLEQSCADDVVSRSGFACTNTRDELAAHIANAQQHMPGVGLFQDGAAQQLHSYATCNWKARGPDGKAVFAGALFAHFDLDGRITEVVSFAG